MSSSDKRDGIRDSEDLDHFGGHIALNFINASRMNAGVPIDIFQTDNDVTSWMKRMGITTPTLRHPLPNGELLQAARGLRDFALDAVERRKAGQPLKLRKLNEFLAKATSHIEVRQNKDAIDAPRVYLANTAEQFLAPVAEEISELLANGNFDLIRRCEGADCILWFLDRTKGHRRRWCSEETCGTRARVAAFRMRQAHADSKLLSATQSKVI